MRNSFFSGARMYMSEFRLTVSVRYEMAGFDT